MFNRHFDDTLVPSKKSRKKEYERENQTKDEDMEEASKAFVGESAELLNNSMYQDQKIDLGD